LQEREPLLTIGDLKTYFRTWEGIYRAVDGVTLCLREKETLGIVGESGCGKSVMALSILKLIPTPPGYIAEGTIIFEGNDLVHATEHQMRKIRGKYISMIFQEPMTSLNPVYTIGDQISETIRLHQHVSRKEARERAVKMLETVKIPSPVRVMKEYPHRLSGGMRQRVMIAIAMACSPKIMIADEPTTALDVTVQAQILDLLLQLKQEMGTAVMLITHDLGVIAENAQRVAVMYLGQIVEEARVKDLFCNPCHPYTQGLMESIPRIDQEFEVSRLTPIPGVVPNLLEMPKGCRFHNRCHRVKKHCTQKDPLLHQISEGHYVRCWLDR
jgi:peptide/nickel transport system ATP-binding protein